MKYLAMLAALGVIYFLIARGTPVASVTQAVTRSEVAPLTTGSREVTPEAKTGLKRPIDRTQSVLKQVEARNGNGEF